MSSYVEVKGSPVEKYNQFYYGYLTKRLQKVNSPYDLTLTIALGRAGASQFDDYYDTVFAITTSCVEPTAVIELAA